MKLLDTCFLIDLQRELHRGINLGAEDFLKKHAREEFGISTISITEFLEGLNRLMMERSFFALSNGCSSTRLWPGRLPEFGGSFD